MIYIVILIALIYNVLILSFIIGFHKIKTISNKNSIPKNTFSIVIPFRNEAHNLLDLLNSISELNYSKQLFEVILVNDDSNDHFSSVIDHFKLQNPTLNILLINVIRESNSPKKDAINTAVKTSQFNWIVTTDADCIVPKNWLQLFNQFIEEEKPVFISAPVRFKAENSFLFHFQNLNFISLIGSSIGGFGIHKPFMCNGANLCYHKETFFKVNGFEGNSAIASGDDIFLLEKMVNEYPTKTKFLKSQEAIVETKSERNWTLFLNQQIRWASKSTSYTNPFTKFVGCIVFAENFLLIILGILAILKPLYWYIFLFFFILKITIDFILILKTSTLLSSAKSIKHYAYICLFYPIFILLIGILSFIKPYEWKGRKFKK